MIAEQPVDQDGIAGARLMHAQVQALAYCADAGRGDEQPIAGALLHHLGIARHDLNARDAGGFRHGCTDAAQQLDRHALFDDDGAGKK